MDMELFFDLNSYLLSMIIGYARLAPSFYMLPFLNSNVLNGVKRNTIIMIIAMAFTSIPLDAIAKMSTSDILLILLQEFLIGVIIGILVSCPFWIFHAVGNLIDNQRGSTLSSTIDPANGIDTSELANFFTYFVAAIYLSSGGFLLLLDIFESSYRICSPHETCVLNPTLLLSIVSGIVEKSIIIASPVLAVMFLAEATLGLLSRFSPQLNAFSISLTVKSLIAIAVLLTYVSPIFPNELMRLSSNSDQLTRWFRNK